MRDVVKTASYISVQHIFAFAADFEEDGFDRIMAAASRSKTVAVGLKASFPFGFQGLLDQCLMGTVAHDGNTKRALFLFAGFRHPYPPNWFGFDSLHVLGVDHFRQG